MRRQLGRRSPQAESLAASFHAAELQALAEEAVASAPGDPAILRKLQAFRQAFFSARD